MEKVDYENIDFEDFDDAICELHKGRLLMGVNNYGFVKPSPIQSKTIQPIKDGRNLIAQARSGSGKTGAFVIGAFAKIIEEEKYPQAVILANTHELATQIKFVAEEIGKKLKINICLCVGGKEENVNSETENLEFAKTSQLLICTPGRLTGLIRLCPLLLSKLKILIFDEADALLADGFIDQIKYILHNIPMSTQICLFSATAGSENIENNKQYILDNPVEIRIKDEEIKVDLIKNFVFNTRTRENKICILEDLYKTINICQSVIFVNSIGAAKDLAKELRKQYSVGLIHGDLPRSERIKIHQKFRETSIRVLIATDVIARGIDIQNVGLIINYEIPSGKGFKECYYHRIGRTGRYGKKGVAISLISNRHEDDRLREISTFYNIDINVLPNLDSINTYLSDSKGYSYTNLLSEQ